MSLTRRLFVRCSAAVAGAVAAVPFVGRRAVGATAGDVDGSLMRAGPAELQAQGLDVGSLLPLAQAVLPAEIGAARIEGAATQFARWIGGYRAGEETLHPYGSERLGATAPSPAAKWREQLAALDADARAAHRGPFREQSLANRTALVRAALAKVQAGARLPSPIAAPHIAVAILAHFAESADGVNLAYGRTIDPRKCRPLAASPNAPVAIARGGRA